MLNNIFNLSSNLSICFHHFPNPFVLFITFKSDNGVIFLITLALANIVCKRSSIVTLQEMCCGLLLSREMWYRKSVLPGKGAR